MRDALRVLAAAAAVGLAAIAHGQTLDLDSNPEAMKWGCVEVFEKQVSERLASSNVGEIERELLRLGVASLNHADDERVLWGVTLIERAAEVQRKVTELGADLDEPHKRTLVIDLQSIAAGVDPDTARLFLNRALAPVIRKELERLKSIAGVSLERTMESVTGLAIEAQRRHAPEDAVVAAQQLEGWLKSGADDPSLALVARDFAADVAAARKILAKAPTWLSVEAVEAFEDAMWIALTADSSGGPKQAAAFALVGTFAELASIADALPKGATRDVLCRGLDQACRPGLFAAVGAEERLARGEAWIELALAAERDRVVVPPLRPAFDAALKDLDRPRIRMMAIGGVIASSGRSATDPEFLAAKASHVELKRRVDLILSASAGLASAENPKVLDKRFAGVANRMLKAWKAIGRKKDAGAEAAMFTMLLNEAAEFARMPREEAFMSAGAERDLQIAERIKADRDAWVKKVANPRTKEWAAESARLRAASHVLRFHADTLSVRTDRRVTLDRLNSLAAWQMSERVWNVHVSEIQRSARRALELLAKGESAEALAEVERVRASHGMLIDSLQGLQDRGDWLELVRDAEPTGGGGLGTSVGVHASLRSWEP